MKKTSIAALALAATLLCGGANAQTAAAPSTDGVTAAQAVEALQFLRDGLKATREVKQEEWIATAREVVAAVKEVSKEAEVTQETLANEWGKVAAAVMADPQLSRDLMEIRQRVERMAERGAALPYGQ